MARMLNTFNANEHDKLGTFTPIPAGIYTAVIDKSEMKDTKDNEGKYLQLTFKVIDGDFVNRTVFDRLNIQNRNVQTVEIAQKTLATICECVGVELLEDSEQLHNIPMNIKVVVKPQSAQYGESNEIKGYEAYDGTAPASPTQGIPAKGNAKLPAAAASAKAAGKTPPWKKGN